MKPLCQRLSYRPSSECAIRFLIQDFVLITQDQMVKLVLKKSQFPSRSWKWSRCVFQGSGGVANANVAARRELNAKIRLNKILLRLKLSCCEFQLILPHRLDLLYFQRAEGKLEEVHRPDCRAPRGSRAFGGLPIWLPHPGLKVQQHFSGFLPHSFRHSGVIFWRTELASTSASRFAGSVPSNFIMIFRPKTLMYLPRCSATWFRQELSRSIQGGSSSLLP